MNMIGKLALGAAALALSVGMASAATITVLNASGDGSSGTTNNAHSFAGSYGAHTAGGNWTTDVTVVTGTSTDVYLSPWHATPLQGLNSYYAAGDLTPDNPATLTFDRNQSSFTMLWGSIDSYNQLTFNNGLTEQFSIDGSTMAAAVNNAFGDTCGSSANFACTALVRFDFGNNGFTSINFYSDGQQAFEFAMIPLPAAGFLLLGGMGVFGGLAAVRRRREKAAA